MYETCAPARQENAAKRQKSTALQGAHAIFRGQLGFLDGAPRWSDTASFAGMSVKPRTKDLIDIACFACTKGVVDESERKRIKQRLMVDISQGISRRPWSMNTCTFTTSAELYSFDLDRLITEKEKFIMLGFPRSTTCFDGVSVSALRDLCGDAMAIPSVTMVMYSALLVLQIPGLWATGK